MNELKEKWQEVRNVTEDERKQYNNIILKDCMNSSDRERLELLKSRFALIERKVTL